jgi:hypothetical protein
MDAPGAVVADKVAGVTPGAPQASGSRNASGAASAAPASSLPSQAVPSIDRMIVKTGTITLEIADLQGAVQRVSAVIAGIPGAYVAASTTTYRNDPTGGAETRPAGVPAVAPDPAIGAVRSQSYLPPGQAATLSIKVPAGSFDHALALLRDVGKPLTEQVSTQEVTEEYVDLTAQVRNLESTEQQYLRLMERAQRLEDILSLQQRVNDVRGQGVAMQAWLDVVIYLIVYLLPLVPVAVGIWWWRARRGPAPSAGGAV